MEVVSSQKIRKGIRNPARAATYFMMKAQKAVGKRVNYGVRPFDRDWDVLVVLDACRYDLFEEVISDHPVSKQLSTFEPVYSCASATPEWLKKSFVDASDSEVNQTHLVSANGWADKVCDTNRFYDYDPVWKHSKEDRVTIVPPSVVTDFAVRAFRDSNAKRYVIHYVQPHAPFLHSPDKYKAIEEEQETQVWNELRHGNVELESVWSDYKKNLHTVLSDVETLIENASGKIVITSDHGNGIGELGVCGHPAYALQPSLKRVPWAEAIGKDRGSYDIKRDENITKDANETDVEEHLNDLGYVM